MSLESLCPQKTIEKLSKLFRKGFETSLYWNKYKKKK